MMLSLREDPPLIHEVSDDMMVELRELLKPEILLEMLIGEILLQVISELDDIIAPLSFRVKLKTSELTKKLFLEQQLKTSEDLITIDPSHWLVGCVKQTNDLISPIKNEYFELFNFPAYPREFPRPYCVICETPSIPIWFDVVIPLNVE